MEARVFSDAGEWTCPKCGEKAMGPNCGRCKFCIYAGILPRVFSSIIDKLFIVSAAKLFLLTRNYSFTHFLIVTLVGFLFYRLYHIGCVALWGQTPGKMAAKIKVMKVDGSSVTWINALLRNSVETLLAFTALYLEMRALSLVSPAIFAATDVSKRLDLINPLVPEWAGGIGLATQVFVLSEFVVLFLNKKKRAILDFIAGTVVIHDPRLPLLPWRQVEMPPQKPV